MFNACEPTTTGGTLRTDALAAWMKRDWFARHPARELTIFWVTHACTNADVLNRYSLALPDGWRWAGMTRIECPVLNDISKYSWDEPIVTQQTGAFVHRFEKAETGAVAEILVTTVHYDEDGHYITTLAAVPLDFLAVWKTFADECARLEYALEPSGQVIVVGGSAQAFVPNVRWEDIILPAELKHDILNDVELFFSKGVEVYRRLNLKPFRKLLLAGVPGTGKTMICQALAGWALQNNYLAIYVSSARRRQGDAHGAHFDKIEHALNVAASSVLPSIILLEELDAYLHPEEKALVLNVLDGSEAPLNYRGTLLVSTTNYPEAIDERVLKRPGRLDRIFIIPQTRASVDAEAMLRRYLGGLWRDEHRALVPALVGYPGAFIREVAVYALMQVAYNDRTDLPLALLEESFERLKAQLDARDDFLRARGEVDAHSVVTNGAGVAEPTP